MGNALSPDNWYIYVVEMSVFFRDIDFGHAANLAVFQADFNTAGMEGRGSEYVLNDAVGAFAGTLIFFKDDRYFQAWVNIVSVTSVHS